MQLLRTINVLTLASLLILTGCFGLGDDTITPADGEEAHPHSDNNNEPASSILQNPYQQVEPNIIYDPTSGDEIVTGFTISVYSAAVDPDGDNITCGWDIGLDGNIDYLTNCAGEFTNITIPIADWIEVPDESYYSVGINSIALIVTDEHGASIADILDLYTELPSEDLEEDNSGGGLTLYVFDGEDAHGSVTDGNGDNLVRITMSQGGDLNWASVSVKISIDKGDGEGFGAPVTCSNPGDDTGNCELVEFGDTGDQFWSVGDGVTIIESGQDLCTSGTCTVKVTIVDDREGKTLDESEATAE